MITYNYLLGLIKIGYKVALFLVLIVIMSD